MPSPRTKRQAAAERMDKLDKKYIWHPFTQMQDWEKEPQIIIESGEGSTLTDINGKTYLDGVSSLWVTVHGHRKKEIDRAVAAQLGKVAHSTLLGLSNVPAVLLAEKLVRIAPRGLARVFYSDSGSTAVEIALKIAFQYWQQKGPEHQKKTGFLSLAGAYHGDTIDILLQKDGKLSLAKSIVVTEEKDANKNPLMYGPVEIAIGDVNSDGMNDIAFTHMRSNTLRVLWPVIFMATRSDSVPLRAAGLWAVPSVSWHSRGGVLFLGVSSLFLLFHDNDEGLRDCTLYSGGSLGPRFAIGIFRRKRQTACDARRKPQERIQGALKNNPAGQSFRDSSCAFFL